MKTSFDAYEFIAVIAPGSVLVAVLMLLWPEARGFLADKSVSIGDLGVAVIAAFVIGHMVQALGAAIEWVFWKPFGGRPTEWVLKPSWKLIDDEQRTRLTAAVSRFEGKPVDLAACDHAAWEGLTREIYARVQAAKRTGRIDVFNRTYGLMRGLCAAFLTAAAIFAVARSGQPLWWQASLVLSAVSLARMCQFGISYGRELFVQFLALDEPPKANSAP